MPEFETWLLHLLALSYVPQSFLSEKWEMNSCGDVRDDWANLHNAFGTVPGTY